MYSLELFAQVDRRPQEYAFVVLCIETGYKELVIELPAFQVHDMLNTVLDTIVMIAAMIIEELVSELVTIAILHCRHCFYDVFINRYKTVRQTPVATEFNCT